MVSQLQTSQISCSGLWAKLMRHLLLNQASLHSCLWAIFLRTGNKAWVYRKRLEQLNLSRHKWRYNMELNMLMKSTRIKVLFREVLELHQSRKNLGPEFRMKSAVARRQLRSTWNYPLETPERLLVEGSPSYLARQLGWKKIQAGRRWRSRSILLSLNPEKV